MCSSFTLIYLLFVFQKNCRDLLSFVSFPFCIFRCLTSLYFLHLLLFNFQGPFSVVLRLDYYITSLTTCQGVFQKFFKNFFQTRLLAVTSSRRLDYYITSLRLCQGVLLKFFKKMPISKILGTKKWSIKWV